VSDPYLDGTFRWWHLGQPSAELAAARADGWLGPPGVAVDLGCGLGTEAGYLAAAGWAVLGADLSPAAVRGAARAHPGARFDLLLDRGCFHYLAPADRHRYAREARRVLRRGGRFLLRACLSAAGVPNDIDQSTIEHVFAGWQLTSITRQDIASGTRQMPALIARLKPPG
jgi:SAM-dependent methyltransferase